MRATTQEFFDVLQLLVAVGADLDHMDHQGNSVLMLSSNDALSVALVWVGAKTYYFEKKFRKRALAMVAANGCCEAMDAIIARDSPDQDYIDRSLHSAALKLSYDSSEHDMTGIFRLVSVYGACVNRCGTLSRCVDRNPYVLSELIRHGADRCMMTWDWQRGKRNTAVHRVAESQDLEVFQALIYGLSPVELDVRDEVGCTPLMTLLSERLSSVGYLRQRFDWLVARGASCLPFDNKGRRVLDTLWGRRQPFRALIKGRVKEENWVKRRGFVFLRKRGISAEDGGEDDFLVLEVAFLAEFGVFKTIVGFL